MRRQRSLIFQSRGNVSDGVGSIILHFARFGTKIHIWLIHRSGESKTEISFWWKPLFIYDNPGTFDDADLSDVTVDGESQKKS